MRDLLMDKIEAIQDRKTAKNIFWGICFVLIFMAGVMYMTSVVLEIGRDNLHNEEVVSLERIVWHMEDGEMAKVVTFYTDGKIITVWVKKDSIQVDTLEFE